MKQSYINATCYHRMKTSQDYQALANTYRMQINTLHTMIWLCKDPTQIIKLKAKIEENQRFMREQEYLASNTEG